MAGTVSGGLQAANTNKQRYGDDFYRKIGAKGGVKGRTGGFYADRFLASYAGRLGGTISRRGGKPLTQRERARIRREFNKNYKNLLAIGKRAERERARANRQTLSIA